MNKSLSIKPFCGCQYWGRWQPWGSYLFKVAQLGEGGERLQSNVDHAEGFQGTEITGKTFDLCHPAVIQVQVFDLCKQCKACELISLETFHTEISLNSSHSTQKYPKRAATTTKNRSWTKLFRFLPFSAPCTCWEASVIIVSKVLVTDVVFFVYFLPSKKAPFKTKGT